jgi:hypothetical protein
MLQLPCGERLPDVKGTKKYKAQQVGFPIAANLVSGFAAAVGQIENDGFAVAFFAVVFVEDRFGDYVLFAGPISEVAFSASFAAKGEIRMDRGIGGGFTYRAFVLHMVLPGL